MTAKTDIQPAAMPLPAKLAEVALISAETCAAIGHMSLSWWQEEVRAKRAPQPVVQRHRCTRWLMAEVHRFWADFAAAGMADKQAAEAMRARLTEASIKARDNRAKANKTKKAQSSTVIAGVAMLPAQGHSSTHPVAENTHGEKP